jgi:hypothetical protein
MEDAADWPAIPGNDNRVAACGIAELAEVILGIAAQPQKAPLASAISTGNAVVPFLSMPSCYRSQALPGQSRR